MMCRWIRVDSIERGRHLYRKRSGMIEPVFGQIKHNGGQRTSLLRGLDGVNPTPSTSSFATGRESKGQLRLLVSSSHVPPGNRRWLQRPSFEAARRARLVGGDR